MSERFDVAIIGAGVAGCTAAIELSRAGLKVVLLDRAKLPRHKVCGCCLNAEAMATLNAIDVTPALQRSRPRAIDSVTLACGHRILRLASTGGISLSRYTLDDALLQAATAAGCTVMDETTVRVQPCAATDPSVTLACRGDSGRSAEPLHARVAVVADGLAGSASAALDEPTRQTEAGSLRGYGTRLPADKHNHPIGQVVMRCDAGGYVGTVVLEDGSLDIAAAMRPDFVKSCRDPAVAVQKICDAAGRSLGTLNEYRWQATAPLTGRRRKLWGPRIFYIGDAAGYVEPFTGEGMAWAMRSARLVKPYVLQGVQDWGGQIGEAWARCYQREMSRKQLRCKLFAAMLRRPSVVAMGLAIGRFMPKRLLATTARFAMPSMFASQPNAKRLTPVSA